MKVWRNFVINNYKTMKYQRYSVRDWICYTWYSDEIDWEIPENASIFNQHLWNNLL